MDRFDLYGSCSHIYEWLDFDTSESELSTTEDEVEEKEEEKERGKGNSRERTGTSGCRPSKRFVALWRVLCTGMVRRIARDNVTNVTCHVRIWGVTLQQTLFGYF